MNPSGSIKDRMVNYALEAAEKRGELKHGDTIVEASSGNTGVSLSMLSALKKYKSIIVVPDSTSLVKVKMMEAYGSKIVYTNSKDGVNETLQKAKQVAEENNAFLLNQFENQDNIKAHNITGKEILDQVGNVDIFVAGIGTGGTLLGVAEILKKSNPETRIIAVEPKKAPAFYNMFYDKNLPIAEGIPHKIEGIGESFVPELLKRNQNIVDEVSLVTDNEAFMMKSRLAIEEGLFIGNSSGANVYVAQKYLHKNKIVITILPDTGMRYI